MVDADGLMPRPTLPGTWWELWTCEPPPDGYGFQVLRDEWRDEADGTYIRVIHEFRLC
jgi:hypothetical protein